MKRFAILIFLLGTAVAFHINKRTHAKYMFATMGIVRQCSKELGVKPGDILLKTTSDDSDGKRQVGCLYSCVFKNLGVMVDGKFIQDNAFEVVDKVHIDNPAEAERVKKTVANCANTVSNVEDTCQKSFKFIECFYTNNQ